MYEEVALALEALGWINQISNIEKVNNIEQKINSLLKFHPYQNNILKILVDSIKYCHKCGSDKWAIYYKPDKNKIRLIMGNLIILVIEEEGIWLALDRQMLEENQGYKDYLEKLNTWTWDNHDYPRYNQVPSINGFYIPSENYYQDWNFIKKLHFEFIEKVNAKYSKINQRSKLNHQKEIIEYLYQKLDIFVPEPNYELLNNTSFTLAEELSNEDEITNLYEGAKQTITVNRYERNNQARQKCIEYYGTDCYICGFNFDKIFGEIGKGFIHVHHLIPLAEINQEYEVDPVKDLRPVCPNCHAMIHKKNPPFTIEEIKNLLNINN
jgi:5-methylcytosine-specific restriction protein A